MSEVRITIATVHNSAEADRVLGRLRQAGMKAFVAGEGTQVQVDAHDAPEAQQIVADLLEPGPTGRADEPEAIFEPTQERPQSSRSRNAKRAWRAAVIGLLFPPVQLYASWLLLKVMASHEELSLDARRRAWFGAIINLGIYTFAVLLVLSPWLNPYRHEVNPLLYEHPPQLSGIWVREDGVNELKLWAGGKLHYRELAEPRCEFAGTWGLGDFQLIFNVRRLIVPGHGYEQGRSYGWALDSFDENHISLHNAFERWRYVRKNGAR